MLLHLSYSLPASSSRFSARNARNNSGDRESVWCFHTCSGRMPGRRGLEYRSTIVCNLASEAARRVSAIAGWSYATPLVMSACVIGHTRGRSRLHAQCPPRHRACRVLRCLQPMAATTGCCVRSSCGAVAINTRPRRMVSVQNGGIGRHYARSAPRTAATPLGSPIPRALFRGFGWHVTRRCTSQCQGVFRGSPHRNGWLL